MAEHPVVELTCRGCGKRFRAKSIRAIWCSGLCRKSTLYSMPCERCGKPHKGRSGGKNSRFCASCASRVSAEKSVIRSAGKRRQIEVMWAEGLTLRELAQALGCTENSMESKISRLRRKGADLPYRYKMSDDGLAAQRLNGRERAARMHAAA